MYHRTLHIPTKVENNESFRKLMVNIINGHRNSHCRLCLLEIEDNYVYLDDEVVLDSRHLPLHELIAELVGDENLNLIRGIESVCIPCVEKLLECHRFKKLCSNSTNILNIAIDSLNSALDQDFGDKTKNLLFLSFSEQTPDNFNEILKTNKIERFKITKSARKKDKSKYLTSNYPQCAHCNDMFQSKKSLLTHLRKFHITQICIECGKTFAGLESLIAHERTHRKTKQDCPNCGKEYLTPAVFENHVNLCSKGLIDPHPRRSESAKPFSCSQCDKSYGTAGGLKVHVRFTHGDAKPHICSECGKKFTAPSCLKSHMVTHTKEKNFECTICKRRCVSKEALLYHTRRHTGERPYTCKLCPERFVNASARAEHIKFRHQGSSHECTYCNKKFVDPKYLKKHIEKHSDRTSRLYLSRANIPPNVPGIENMRIKTECLLPLLS